MPERNPTNIRKIKRVPVGSAVEVVRKNPYAPLIKGDLMVTAISRGFSQYSNPTYVIQDPEGRIWDVGSGTLVKVTSLVISERYYDDTEIAGIVRNFAGTVPTFIRTIGGRISRLSNRLFGNLLN